MIRVRGLRAGYHGQDVLHGLDLDLAPGEMAGLLGPNGAGKSTLLGVLSGALAPSGGEVLLDGRPLSNLSARRRARLVAAVPQRAHTAFAVPVRSMVLFGRYAHAGFWGSYGPEDEDAADAAMAETDTAHLAARPVDELSGGELQRVLLARALAQDTPALLLDEPASGLDPAHAVAAFGLLRARHRAGRTVLAATHDVNVAALHCPRLIFLKAGRIVLDGPTHEVLTEAAMREVYGTAARVLPHPDTGAPQVLLLPRGADHA